MTSLAHGPSAGARISALGGTATGVRRQLGTAPRSPGRGSSYDWLVSLAAQPLGVILAPIALHAWGAEPPLLASAVLVAAVCAGTALAPSVRNLRLDQAGDTSGNDARALGETASADKTTSTA
ncbi:hypothetical protein ACF1BS_34035 [Streptomyces sp. NPDC014748]|uniref:hypothetical protein n=1 Tax=Streptomyces sp. NPDC014748 TaxID=3364905 RepID=UPI0036F8FDC9